MFLVSGLVDVVFVYTITTAFGSSTDSTAAPVTSVLLVTLACLLGATIASTNLRYWASKSPLRYAAARSARPSMFSGVYVHSVVIAFAAVRATFILVAAVARSARYGCMVA